MAGCEKEVQEAIRVIVLTRITSPRWSLAKGPIEDFIPIVAEELKGSNIIPTCTPESELKFMAKSVSDRMVLIAVDIFHTSYDLKLAHLPEHNELPVVTICYYRNRAITSLATTDDRNKANTSMADLHMKNGWDVVPPFFEDHTGDNFPTYIKPRNQIRGQARF